MTKTVIAGSRNVDMNQLYWVRKQITQFNKTHAISEVISGTAKGVDHIGEYWANMVNIPIKRFPANWNKYGKAAGMIRNEEMANYCDNALIFWDGESPGTKGMINYLQKIKKKHWICNLKTQEIREYF